MSLRSIVLAKRANSSRPRPKMETPAAARACFSDASDEISWTRSRVNLSEETRRACRRWHACTHGTHVVALNLLPIHSHAVALSTWAIMHAMNTHPQAGGVHVAVKRARVAATHRCTRCFSAACVLSRRRVIDAIKPFLRVIWCDRYYEHSEELAFGDTETPAPVGLDVGRKRSRNRTSNRVPL